MAGYRGEEDLLDFHDLVSTQGFWAFGHRLPKMSFSLEDSNFWSKATRRFDSYSFLLTSFRDDDREEEISLHCLLTWRESQIVQRNSIRDSHM